LRRNFGHESKDNETPVAIVEALPRRKLRRVAPEHGQIVGSAGELVHGHGQGVFRDVTDDALVEVIPHA
jgi:hypothetical protein